MPGHDLVVIGASAGGVEALKELVTVLPVNFPAAILIVLHLPAYGTSALPAILSRAGQLPAVSARNQQLIELGRIYVAPPDHHLLVQPGHIEVTRGPRENGHRPAVDPLFRSAARAYGPRVIGVVLSGLLDDGTAGLHMVKRRGGIAVVQDPKDALYEGMPRSAIEQVAVDHVVPVSEMGGLLTELAQQPVSADPFPITEVLEAEVDMAEMDVDELNRYERPGKPSAFVCPACGGTLFELDDGRFIHFRCRVGHAYGAETLFAEQTESLEEAFWVALRALEESAAMARALAERSRSRGNKRAAARFDAQAKVAEDRAKTVRDVLLEGTLSALRNPLGEGNSGATDLYDGKEERGT